MSKPNEGNAPKLVVEQGDASAANEERVEGMDEAMAAEDPAPGRKRSRKERKKRITREDLEGAMGFVQGLGAAAWVYAGNHPYTVGYGFIGLVLAVLILTIGLWSTIVIAVFVIVGAMIGQIRDGDNGIVNFFGRLFSGRNS